MYGFIGDLGFMCGLLDLIWNAVNTRVSFHTEQWGKGQWDEFHYSGYKQLFLHQPLCFSILK